MAEVPVTRWLTVNKIRAEHPGVFSRNALYAWIADGTIPSIRLGRKILLPADALDRVLAVQQAAE